MLAAQLPSNEADLASFCQSVELAVAAAYDTLMPRFGDTVRPVVETFRSHHVAHAEAIGRGADSAGPAAPNAGVVAVLAPRIDAAIDEPSALQLVVALENQLAATHAFSLTSLEEPSMVRTVSTILPIESTHAAVASELLGTPLGDRFVNGSFESTLVGDGTSPRAGFSPFVFST